MAHVLTPQPGKGTILQLKIASVFTPVGQLVEVDGPDAELKMRDTTHLGSAYMSKRPAIADLGKMSGTILFDPDDTVTHTVIRALLYAPPASPSEWKLIYKTSDVTSDATDDFLGYLTKFAPTGMKVDDNLQAKFEIDITDQYTISQGV